ESRFDGAHENKSCWINPGILLLGSCSVFSSGPKHGHVETKRSEFEDHTRDIEEYHGGLFEHARAGESKGGWHRREREAFAHGVDGQVRWKRLSSHRQRGFRRAIVHEAE